MAQGVREGMMFTDEDLLRLWECVDPERQTLRCSISNKYSDSPEKFDLACLLRRLEAGERVAKEAETLEALINRMRKDHHDKLIENKTLESASENWNTLLQEPLEFGPLIESLRVWRKECGK